MGALLYYLPGKQAVTAADLNTAGLGYVAEPGDGVPSRGVTRGPDGQAGAIAGPGADSADVGYWPDRQTWQRVPGATHWIGWAIDSQPGPNVLARRSQLPGHYIELADGNQWLVPVARSWSSGESGPRYRMALPAPARLDDNGEWVRGEVCAKYRALWDAACVVWDLAMGGVQPDADKVVVTLSDELDTAALALQTNYRVGRVECAALGLLSEDAAASVAMALIDWPTLLDLLGNA